MAIAIGLASTAIGGYLAMHDADARQMQAMEDKITDNRLAICALRIRVASLEGNSAPDC